MQLDDILARLNGLGEDARAQVVEDALKATADLKWIPSPGPQTEAYFSQADVLLYGGAGGSGKSSLLNGLAQTQHRRSLLMRRQYTDLGALIEEAISINGGRDGFNGSPPPKLRTADGRLIEFGAAKGLGDEQTWQGQAHDFLGFDEAVQFLEQQVRFLMGWVRVGPGVPQDQRCRVLLASNPPVTADGQWIIGMFRPWLDVTHPNPAKHGELRWFVTDPDGKDFEVPGPEPYQFPGQQFPARPMSRTFIPGRLADNPFLINTNYSATLDALPEPLRSAIRDGNFMAARRDDEWQVIPTAWVQAAQGRWTEQAPPGVPMCAIGVDVAQGGDDETVLAPRHDGWFAPLVAVPGKDTPDGPSVAGRILVHRRDGAVVVVDMGGGYGGSAYDHLKGNGVSVVAYKGAAKDGVGRTRDRQMGFVNKRSEAIWRFREALDPSQPGGSPIALPPDPMLVADLTAPTWEPVSHKGGMAVKVESKEDIVKRLGRSPDRGDAVVMAWSHGLKAVNVRGGFVDEYRPDQRTGGGRGIQVVHRKPR
jgi:hypothetical protein